ncbi:MAG TPA: hypothetical protein VK808_09260, partial [Bacteroidia bacterium]|nr:hypothetical protein [Bacteroidia bacterium]
MKNLLKISAAGLVVFSLASCGSQENIAGHNDDGVYASRDNATASTNTAPPSAPGNVQPQNNMTPADSNQNQNNYYSNDYSDYDYSSRIKRYDQDWGYNGYYDDVYTNSYYYSYDPYLYGTSIYLGSPWWGYPY